MSQPAPLPESALYEPVRALLVAAGYTVRGEVLGCDIAAVRDGALVVVELKRRLGVDLLVQATQRQRACDTVYVALPETVVRDGRTWRRKEHLLKRLELGLILVRGPRARVVFRPQPCPRNRRKKQQRALIAEVDARSGDYHPGGVPGRKVVTAYREAALWLAWRLAEGGAQSPRALRTQGGPPHTQRVLYQDVYQWFTRTGRGLYDVNEAGRAALRVYADVVAGFSQRAGPPQD